MDTAEWSPVSGMQQALSLIQLQLVELAGDYKDKFHRGLVASRNVVELQNKLEKLLYKVNVSHLSGICVCLF